MQVKFNLNIKIILIIVLILGLIVSNVLVWRKAIKNTRISQGVVNYINTQIQKGRLVAPEVPKPQPPKPQEPKKEGNDG